MNDFMFFIGKMRNNLLFIYNNKLPIKKILLSTYYITVSFYTELY